MIKAVDVYNTALSLAKKDQRGGAFNVDEYNLASSLVNIELYNSLVAKYETSKEVSELLNPFKVRGASITLTAGQGEVPGACNKILGMPYVTHPWGRVTATDTVTIVYDPDAKVKVTSANHGLKDGDVVTVTGLSVHTITSQAIHYIDKNNFWVDVNYTGPDVLNNAAWTVAGASYKEVDFVTEEELSTRFSDSLTKPTIQDPVYVLDTADYAAGAISAMAYSATGRYAGYVSCITNIDHGLRTGDVITISSVAAHVPPGTWIGTHVVTVVNNRQFVFQDTVAIGDSAVYSYYKRQRINVYPTSILSVLINYLRVPRTPFLDYYVDANYSIQFMDAYQVSDTGFLLDSTHTLAAGEVYRDGEDTDGVIVYSQTVDWEWDEDALPQIVYMVLQKMGINLENISVAQLATQLGVKEEAQA